MLFSGIDLHKRTVAIHTLDAAGATVRTANLPTQRRALTTYFEALPGPHRAVVECTGMWYWLRDLLVAQGIDLRLGHARYLKAISYAKVKTDAVDAATLAQLLRVDLIPEAHMISPALRETRVGCSRPLMRSGSSGSRESERWSPICCSSRSTTSDGSPPCASSIRIVASCPAPTTPRRAGGASGRETGIGISCSLFTHAAVRAVQYVPEIRAESQRLVRRKGKAIARALIAKELGSIVYHVLTRQEAFNGRFRGLKLTRTKSRHWPRLASPPA
jgi:hypothetical protein